MCRTAALVVAVLTGGLLTGCGAGEGAGAGAAGVSVVAAAYPYQFLAGRVGGDLVSVQNLTAPGVEPHDVELTPQQLADVIEADLVIYEGTFQASVDDAVEQSGLADDQLLDVTSVAPLQDTGAVDDKADALDPHIWLDPTAMVAITRAVADALVRADAEHADVYRANAERLVRDLEALDTALRNGLADCARTTVVTSHDAFRYLGAEYGLDMVPIAGVDPTQEPSPSEQADIADLVETEDVTTIFTEELVSPAVAQSVADETGAEIATLNPIEGLSDDTADEDYLSLMRANLRALETANGCS